MTDTNDINPTPDHVADLARSEEQIPLDRVALIGVRSTPEGNRALVRLEDGRIESLGEGDTADDITVIAVAEDALQIVDRRGAARTLTMPG
ncbi:hypothetical protein EU805_09300 [Salipiger sp. IMCC34102]|uniref:hypothetical protein n=1 Tax=Salipiger sp. IMCC34102 TaxID=2510647 RepID=UPI00101B67BE|nr:hypothetical protein [Salipiger sp. IMCC34102]RYH02786.1 hypothetical protein EU805_09300 [Salipiger sp. IMCC34102]